LFRGVQIYRLPGKQREISLQNRKEKKRLFHLSFSILALSLRSGT